MKLKLKEFTFLHEIKGRYAEEQICDVDVMERAIDIMRSFRGYFFLPYILHADVEYVCQMLKNLKDDNTLCFKRRPLFPKEQVKFQISSVYRQNDWYLSFILEILEDNSISDIYLTFTLSFAVYDICHLKYNSKQKLYFPSN